MQLILSRCILGPASHLILVRDEGVTDTSSDVFIRRLGNSEEEINITFTKWESLYFLGDAGLYNSMNQQLANRQCLEYTFYIFIFDCYAIHGMNSLCQISKQNH